MKNIEIWQLSIPLAEAEFQFAPASLSRKYGRKWKVPRTRVEASKDHPLEVFRLLNEGVSNFQQKSEIRTEIREWLMRELSDGRLIAYGFRMQEPLANDPIEIPAYMFDIRFANWTDSSLKGFGQEFIRVRVKEA